MIEDGKYDLNKGIEIILREHARRLECQEFIDKPVMAVSDIFREYIVHRYFKSVKKTYDYDKELVSATIIDKANAISKSLDLITPDYVDVKRGYIFNHKSENGKTSRNKLEEIKDSNVFSNCDVFTLELFDILIDNLTYYKKDGQKHATVNKKTGKVNWNQIPESVRYEILWRVSILSEKRPNVWTIDEYDLRIMADMMQVDLPAEEE